MDFYVDILANIIIQQYFRHSRCLIIFSDNSTQFQYTGNLPLINLKSVSGDINSEILFRHHGCQGVVIKSKNHLNIFKNLEHEIQMRMERFNQRKYLFLPREETVDNISNIFQSNALRYVADLVIIEEDYEKTEFGLVPHTDVAFSLWSHQYVGSTNNSNKVFLDTWFSINQSFEKGTPLYKSKLLDQMGREVNMATFQYEPYSIIGSKVNDHKGSEMSTAMMFAKHYNMTPIIVINPEDYWGQIFDNWTGSGLMGNLVTEKADIGFAALYTWECAYHFLDISKPLVRTGITCLVPAPKLAAGWLTPFYSYSPAMWYAVGSTFVLSVISHFLTRSLNASRDVERIAFVKRNPMMQMLSQSIFTIVKIFLLQVVTKSDQLRSFIGKYLTGGLFVFSLFVCSSFSSGLSTIMTIPRRSRLCKSLGGSAIRTYTLHSLKFVLHYQPIYREIVRRFVATSEENLRDYSKTSNFAFSLERLPNSNYAIGNYIQDDVIDNFHLMQEDFYWEQCVIMTRKSSVLLPLLDMFVLRVFETGLISYWQNEATALYMNAKVQKAVEFYNYNKDRAIVKLKWIHVEGAFGILCIGLISSIIVFISEIVLCHNTTIRGRKCSC